MGNFNKETAVHTTVSGWLQVVVL